jgi:hypothetical protein
MKFILLVHHDETAFEQMSDETKKGPADGIDRALPSIGCEGGVCACLSGSPGCHGDPRAGPGRAFAGDRWPFHRNAGADGGLFPHRGEGS